MPREMDTVSGVRLRAKIEGGEQLIYIPRRTGGSLIEEKGLSFETFSEKA